MTTHYKCVTLVAISILFIPGITPRAAAKRQLFEVYKPVIVIDPGHGGENTGAGGTEGTVEKAVVLRFAQILKAELDREYRVVLTRSDDSPVDLEIRTSLANHNKADVFISLHTGGSFVHSTSGVLIYYYQDFSGEYQDQDQTTPDEGQDQDTPVLWNRAQIRHQENSRILANLIQSNLSALSAVEESQVRSAPLLVLQGANMPAILIEIGYLTNPADEKKMTDQAFLTDFARAIKKGIDQFFEQEQ
jgi:N-acetylmuramoyl-L-alanine amidase